MGDRIASVSPESGQKARNKNLPPISPKHGTSKLKEHNSKTLPSARNTSSTQSGATKNQESSGSTDSKSKDSGVKNLSSSFAKIDLGSKSAGVSVKHQRGRSGNGNFTQSRSYSSVSDLVRGLKISSFQNIVVVQGAG